VKGVFGSQELIKPIAELRRAQPRYAANPRKSDQARAGNVKRRVSDFADQRV
jgi:hypothetical protein